MHAPLVEGQGVGDGQPVAVHLNIGGAVGGHQQHLHIGAAHRQADRADKAGGQASERAWATTARRRFRRRRRWCARTLSAVHAMMMATAESMLHQQLSSPWQ